jgi:hypothetical protein
MSSYALPFPLLMPEKLFTLEEALVLLPTVRQLVLKIRAAHSASRPQDPRLELHRQAPAGKRLMPGRSYVPSCRLARPEASRSCGAKRYVWPNPLSRHKR